MKTYIIHFGKSSFESKPNESLKNALIHIADYQDRWGHERGVITDIICLTEDREIVFSKAKLDLAVKFYESLFPEDGYYERRFTGKPIYNVLQENI